jgi:hypothetical protein
LEQGRFRHFIPLVTDNVSLLIEAGIEPKVVSGCQACRFNYRIFSTSLLSEKKRSKVKKV